MIDILDLVFDEQESEVFIIGNDMKIVEDVYEISEKIKNEEMENIAK